MSQRWMLWCCASSVVACAPSVLVRFSGNSALSDVELREVMCSGKPVSEACPEQGLPARDKQALERLYEERGYIAHVTVPPLDREGTVPIVVQVVEGPQYVFGRIQVSELQPEPVEVELAGRLTSSVAPGATYSKGAFFAWMTTFLERRGALGAEWTSQFTADSETRRVDIIVKIKRP